MAEEREERKEEGIIPENTGTRDEGKEAFSASGNAEAQGAKGSARRAGGRSHGATKNKGGADAGMSLGEAGEAAPSSEGEEMMVEARGGQGAVPEDKPSAESDAATDSPGAERGKAEEEEFRRLVEESLEKVTVAEVTLAVMNQFASLGYLKMGLPESVNLKYRDLSQALLAIDLLEAMIKGAEGKIPEEKLKPFRGTLANLQLNYVQLKKRLG